MKLLLLLIFPSSSCHIHTAMETFSFQFVSISFAIINQHESSWRVKTKRRIKMLTIGGIISANQRLAIKRRNMRNLEQCKRFNIIWPIWLQPRHFIASLSLWWFFWEMIFDFSYSSLSLCSYFYLALSKKVYGWRRSTRRNPCYDVINKA